MQRNDNLSSEKVDFEDKSIDRCVAKITRLQELINIEEAKLFKAMRSSKNKMVVSWRTI